MRRSSPVVSVVLALALGLAASPAHAESTPSTSITQLMVLEPGDASYKLFHGAIWLEHDKATWNYRWGGLQCKGRDLSDMSVQILFSAFRSKYSVALEYVQVDYKGKPFRRVTGFVIGQA